MAGFKTNVSIDLDRDELVKLIQVSERTSNASLASVIHMAIHEYHKTIMNKKH